MSFVIIVILENTCYQIVHANVDQRLLDRRPVTDGEHLSILSLENVNTFVLSDISSVYDSSPILGFVYIQWKWATNVTLISFSFPLYFIYYKPIGRKILKTLKKKTWKSYSTLTILLFWGWEGLLMKLIILEIEQINIIN